MKASLMWRLVTGACLSTACSDLTKVDAPGIVQPAAVDNSQGADARYAGAAKLFVNASIASIRRIALISDEWIYSDFAGNSDAWLADSRRPSQPGVFETGSHFLTISNARINLAFAAVALRTYAPTPPARLGKVLAYSGYMELFLAEQFCNGIPFSTINEAGEYAYGGPTTTTNVYLLALAHFDSAATLSADSARVLNLVRVGRGRTLLDLGRYADAAAAVAAVPTSFVYNLDVSAGIANQTNTLYSDMVGKTVGVPRGSDGGTGIDWVGANDPRVPLQSLGKGNNLLLDVYQFRRYSSLDATIPIATGVEARLIEAEAALQANRNDSSTTGTGWLGNLNTLRASAIAPALAPLADPGSFDARVNLLFRERAFWMFLTGHRQGDMRRLVRQYGRAQNTVFPSGTYWDGAAYGSEVTLVIPLTEAPNGNYTGCIDRNA